MLTSQRKQHILDVLKREGQVIAKTLSQELGLSEDTIRRDLRELAQEGLLQRVHGGALPVSPAIANFADREDILQEENNSSLFRLTIWYFLTYLAGTFIEHVWTYIITVYCGQIIITINKNVTVTWTNVDAMPHTVTADDNSFTSDELNQNDTYSHTFTTDGTFDYHCAIHTGMKGTVVVNY